VTEKLEKKKKKHEIGVNILWRTLSKFEIQDEERVCWWQDPDWSTTMWVPMWDRERDESLLIALMASNL